MKNCPMQYFFLKKPKQTNRYLVTRLLLAYFLSMEMLLRVILGRSQTEAKSEGSIKTSRKLSYSDLCRQGTEQPATTWHQPSAVAASYSNEKIHTPFSPPLQIAQPLQAVACFQAFVPCSMNFASSGQ